MKISLTLDEAKNICSKYFQDNCSDGIDTFPTKEFQIEIESEKPAIAVAAKNHLDGYIDTVYLYYNLMNNEKKIEAIRHFRSLTNLSIQDSKAVIEAKSMAVLFYFGKYQTLEGFKSWSVR